jgi:uncharacterized protein YkwD
MNGKLSIIISVILVTAAILTVQSSSMLQISYAQSCPDGSTPDASGSCPTEAPPAGDGETAQAPPPAGDGETAQAPPPAGDEQTAQAPPATTEIPPPATEAPPATEIPPPATEAPPATTEIPPPATEAPPPTVASQVSNNTGGMSADWINSILSVYNRERAAVGVPPYVWNDTLAAHAQAWVDYMAAGKTGGRFGHCNYFPEYQQIEECSHVEEAEGLAGIWAVVDPPALIELFMAEKPGGHYLGIVSAEWKSIGCGYATSTNLIDAEGKPISIASILGCRYQ